MVQPDSHAGALEAILLRCLCAPQRLGYATVCSIQRTLQTSGLSYAVYDTCLYALGALIYARPTLLTESTLDSLKAVLGPSGVPPLTQQRACEVLKFALVTPVARRAMAILETLLLLPGLEPAVYSQLVQVLLYAAGWCLDLVRLDQVLDIAAAEHLAEHRDALLGGVIGRLVFVAPETFTSASLHRLAVLYGEHGWFPCLLFYLRGRAHTSSEAAQKAVTLLGDHFPLQATVREHLGSGKKRLVIVHNIDDGQGDEIVRVGTLTQACLDANPALEVVLVTKRLYLYDNARVTPVLITDAEHVDPLFQESCDGIVYFHEPVVPSIQYRSDLRPLVQAYTQKYQPFLVLTAQKGTNQFVFETVTVSGMPYEIALSFDTPLIPNIYEPMYRVLAELGLPLRAGEEGPGTSSLFIGEPCQEAEAVWHRLVGCCAQDGTQGEAQRPVALVNPFGGQGRLKGYAAETLDVLAGDLCDLVAEGFFAVLVPNGTPWGNAVRASEVLALLPPEVRVYVVVAPDPGTPGAEVECAGMLSRQGLPYADQIMRFFKYFVSYADLVVTVEGWMMHLAYHLGKPYRLLLLPQSHAFHWHPYGAGRHQAVVTHMSPTAAWPDAPADRLCASEKSMLPGYPRKDILRFVLSGLAEIHDPRVVPLLLRAHASPDGHVRAAALAALACHGGPQVEQVLLAALKDKVAEVRCIAARALLATGDDWTPRLGSDAEQTLVCHTLIAEQRWRAVLVLGKATFRALSVAVNDADDVIRREATQVFWRLLQESRAQHVRHEG